MSWPKLKNIILLMLVMVDLVLAGLALFYWQKEEEHRRTAMENAVELLEKQGVRLQTQWDDMTLPVLELQRDTQQERSLAVALLGEVRREDRGAGVYRYFNEKGSIQFHSNGEFSAAFSDQAFPLEGKTPEEHGTEILKALDFQGDVLAVKETDGAVTVTVGQRCEGTLVLPCQAVLVYEDGCLTAISQGRRVNGTPYAAAQQEEAISAAGALVRFVNGLRELGDVCSSVTEVEESYRLSTSFSGPTQLIPVWLVTTDTGSYQLDALTGELSDSGIGGTL